MINRIVKSVLFFFLITMHAQAQTIHVSDFGVQPNSFTDVTAAVQKAIDACKDKPGAVLVFPKGRYDFWPEQSRKRTYFVSNTTTETEAPSKVKNVAMLLEGIKGLTIEGNGSTFIFHGKTILFAVDQSQDIKIQNISFDYERPTMSELTIEKLDNNVLVANIHPDSKYAIIDGKIVFYGEGWSMHDHFFSIQNDTLQGTNLYASLDPIRQAKATEIAPFKVRFENDFSNVNYEVGSILATRSHIRDHVGVFINLSKNVELYNLNFHYMHGLGIVTQFSENLNYKKVNLVPTKGRATAAFADGMHFSGCKGHIAIDSCHFRGLQDDPINVHGTYLQVTKIDNPKRVLMRFMHGQTYGFPAFFANDAVAFIDAHTLQKRGMATVTKVEKVSDREMWVTLDKALPANFAIGDCLENITWNPSLHVSNSKFEGTNTRGLLITTPKKVVVENNLFYRTGMYAIQIAGDANSWFESGAVEDVIIRNNIFDGCNYNNYYDNRSYVIGIIPENHEIAKNAWVHRNINIENNTFKVLADNLILQARSTEILNFKGNTVEYATFKPQFKNRQKATSNAPSFILDNCTKVNIQGNTFKVQPTTIRLENMKKSDVKFQKGITEISQ